MCQSSASVMGLSVSSPPSDHLVAGIMLLSVVSTKDCHTMPSDPEPAGQSRRRGSPKHPQHYTRPCRTLVPATGPRNKRRRSWSAPRKAAPPSRRSSAVGPTELGCVNPHPVQHNRKLAGKRDFRPLHAAPLCHPHSPSLQGGEPGGPRHMICAASKSAVRTMASPTRLIPPSMSVSPD